MSDVRTIPYEDCECVFCKTLRNPPPPTTELKALMTKFWANQGRAKVLAADREVWGSAQHINAVAAFLINRCGVDDATAPDTAAELIAASFQPPPAGEKS